MYCTRSSNAWGFGSGIGDPSKAQRGEEEEAADFGEKSKGGRGLKPLRTIITGLATSHHLWERTDIYTTGEEGGGDFVIA